MIIFTKTRYKNILSSGNTFTEVDLNTSKTTLIVGTNGAGKCVHESTEIDVEFDDPYIEKLFRETFT